MKLSLAFCVALLVAGLLGCGKPDPVVGEWKGAPAAGSGMTQVPDSKLTLADDGTFSVSNGATSFSGTWERTEGGITARATKRNGQSVAGKDDMVLDLKLSDDGHTLKSSDNPIEWKK